MSSVVELTTMESHNQSRREMRLPTRESILPMTLTLRKLSS